jgi:glutaredoxin
MTEPLRLYWQPGCTSCLRAKEFLRERGIDFVSIDVRATPSAQHALEALGVRTVPVLARGHNYTLAQDVDELAAFVGVRLNRERLEVDTLVARLDALLAVAQTLTATLSAADGARRVPGRERTWLDLAYHIAMIADGFLDAASGGELTYAHYERLPAPFAAAPEVVAAQSNARTRLGSWRRLGDTKRDSLRTYFGERPLHVVLERSTWHVAQHVRQLQALVATVAGASVAPPLDAALLAGLPLPRDVWDQEVTQA